MRKGSSHTWKIYVSKKISVRQASGFHGRVKSMTNKKWSYSRWSMFDKCQLQYFYAYIKKLPRDMSSPALKRGLKIHKLAEDFVLGKISKLPKELRHFAGEFKALKTSCKKGQGFTEPDVSMDSRWVRSELFESDYFLGFIDYIHFNNDGSVTVIDYKTGRQYPGHRDQAHVYAMVSMALEPNITKVDVEFWYLDSGQTREWQWGRKDFETMKKIWVSRIGKMHDCKDFQAMPNKFCKWCSYNIASGGPCKYA